VILADTSIWIDHLRAGDEELGEELRRGNVAIHPLIIAELALRSLRERARTLALLDALPQVRVARLSEVRRMIESRRLYGLGIGLMDAHLIASVMISSPTLLWTRDKPLRRVAAGLGVHTRMT
jgi:predicted nucleic acid-binding protein